MTRSAYAVPTARAARCVRLACESSPPPVFVSQAVSHHRTHEQLPSDLNQPGASHHEPPPHSPQAAAAGPHPAISCNQFSPCAALSLLMPCIAAIGHTRTTKRKGDFLDSRKGAFTVLARDNDGRMDTTREKPRVKRGCGGKN